MFRLKLVTGGSQRDLSTLALMLIGSVWVFAASVMKDGLGPAAAKTTGAKVRKLRISSLHLHGAKVERPQMSRL
jgi:hypothetical protein